MREAVYLILSLAGPASIDASDPYKQHPAEPERHGAPARLDLRMPAPDVLPYPEVRPLASAGRLNPIAAPTARQGAGLAVDAAREALAWVQPAGWGPVAAAAFDSSAPAGHGAWPVGGTVPSLRATAAISTTVKNPHLPVLDVNRSVTRNRRFDAPIGCTYLDCSVRLDVSPAARPSLALLSPCGPYGQFGASLQRPF